VINLCYLKSTFPPHFQACHFMPTRRIDASIVSRLNAGSRAKDCLKGVYYPELRLINMKLEFLHMLVVRELSNQKLLRLTVLRLRP
jgi:hypothetical protein